MTQRRKRTLLFRLYAFAVIELVLIVGITTARLRLSSIPLPSQALVERVANYLATELTLVRDDSTALEQELARVKSEMNASAALYDRDGKLVASNTTPPPPLVTPNKGNEGKRAGEVTTGALVRTAAHGDETLSFLVAPLPRPERNDSITLAIVLLIVALPALLFAREMAVPLQRLAEAARKLGGGDLKIRTGIRRRDELGEVAEAFDEMATRLEQLVKSQRELLANVSHELRTPLARIRV
ncbi:MAG: HAMP domain-containing protein, partial [Myxococcaceae bacterium]